VLALRFIKRIAAHMANIATTVVMPVDRLDFYDETGAAAPREPDTRDGPGDVSGPESTG
jgi:hypothetical protein